MSLIKRILIIFLSCWLFVNSVFAAGSFIVKDIRIVGAQGISRGTLLSYLPIKVGDEMNDTKTASILQALYGSGLFTDVRLSRDGNTLVIKVMEQAVISNIKYSGNSAVSNEDIDKMLKENELTVGNVFSHSALEKFKRELLAQYENLGYYNVQVKVKNQALARNRIGVDIQIHEGKVAKVRQINIIGNHAFPKKTLLKQLLLTTPGFFTFLTKTDQYSKAKLDASLESLRAYYMDRGYIYFKIDSYNVDLRDNNEGVYITIELTEGDKYTFQGYEIEGNTIVPRKELEDFVAIKPGEVFSRKVVEKANEMIGLALGAKGYAFARVEPIPTINEETRQVFVTFKVIPGPQVYVRRVTFVGNNYTSDNVLRRVIQQMEGSLLSVIKVRESIRQLNILGFFSDVQVKTIPVPGTNNQVDLEFQVTEAPSGQASVSIGYGTLGLELSAGINQPNFLGTGRSVGLNVNHTNYSTNYSFNYYNPYYTVNNIGRGMTLFYTQTTPGDLNLANYKFDTYGGSIYYNIPMTINNRLLLGYAYKHINLTIGNFAATEFVDFVEENGDTFNLIVFNAGWINNSQDRSFFPTRGYSHGLNFEVSAPIFGKNLNYYKLDYNGDWLYPINKSRSFIFEFRGGAGYGNGYGNTDDGLPFFLNYFAGGLSEGLVRGYETNTLGPRDSRGSPIGGNVLVHATAGLIFPNFISPETLRTQIFMDAGNVYQTNSENFTFGAGPIRYSLGIAAQWRSPIGPLIFSLAKAINPQDDDRLQAPQFNMATTF